jgi:spermidine synthase
LIHRSDDDGMVVEVFDDNSVRALHFGTSARQSAMYLHAPDQLALPYTRCMMTALLFQPKPARVLMVGLGGGSMAKFLLRHFPDCRLDVVESSARVVDVARRYFDLPQSPRLRVHTEDGARFVHALPAEARYDAILIDAFTADGVPATINQQGFLAACATRLDADGVLACNLWARRHGYATALRNLRRQFGRNVFTLQVRAKGNAIAIAAPAAPAGPVAPALKPAAVTLQRQLNLRLCDYLDQLRRDTGLLAWLRG